MFTSRNLIKETRGMSIMNGLKAVIRHSPFYPLVRKWKNRLYQARSAEIHRVLHNENPLFYTLSPMLLVAIIKAFNIQYSVIRGGGGIC